VRGKGLQISARRGAEQSWVPWLGSRCSLRRHPGTIAASRQVQTGAMPEIAHFPLQRGDHQTLQRMKVMKLYYARGACSLSPHIALREAELPFELVKVDLKTKRLASGADFGAINPNGYVPVLELDTGVRLTEGPAIVQYIADQVPAKKLAPANGTMGRYRLQEWLNFITAEIHKGFSALFADNTPEDYKLVVRARLQQRFAFVDLALADGSFLAGNQFSVADGYLFVMTTWCKAMKVDFDGFPRLRAFADRVANRHAVRQALEAEERASA
jgi:glutathione S-transferase